MARHRTKKRTHLGSLNPTTAAPPPTPRAERPPKSMVIRIGAGEVGSSVSQLVKDVRKVMEPDTATKLKERRANRLRDYTTMTGPLGVTHLLLFARSKQGNTNLRLAVTPRGPTLHFNVENYSLSKDILRTQRHPKLSPDLHLNPPLLVMNNFITIPRDSKDPSLAPKRRLESLVTDFFRSLFPQVAPQSTPLASVKRVLLLNREPEASDSSNGTYTITLRHYAISTKLVGLSKAIKRINAAEKVSSKNVPNLGQLEDVSHYILDPTLANYTSASESEADTDAEVEVLNPRTRTLHYRDKLEKIQTQGKRIRRDGKPAVEKRGIVLSEIGPRMRLRLIKVEENLCQGKIMWHEFVQKSHEQELEMDKVWERRKGEKAERKRIQKENLLKNRKEREALKGTADGEGDEEMDSDDYEDVDSDLDSGAMDEE